MNLQNTSSKISIFQLLAIGVISWSAASPAYAHHAMGGQTPQTFVQGFISGLAHPVIGLDHFAFLVVAALLAFATKGMARYTLPLVFVVTTVGGTALHLAGSNLPLSELIVAATVITGAILTLIKRDQSALFVGSLFIIAGMFHGYAYGESIIGAENSPLAAYFVGFSAIQYALILGGVFGLEQLGKRSVATQQFANRLGSGLALLTGSVFLLLAV